MGVTGAFITMQSTIAHMRAKIDDLEQRLTRIVAKKDKEADERQTETERLREHVDELNRDHERRIDSLTNRVTTLEERLRDKNIKEDTNINKMGREQPESNRAEQGTAADRSRD
jgi:hypothetical protein